MTMKLIFTLVSVLIVTTLGVESCKVVSEKLKIYTQNHIERLLDPNKLRLIYWLDEPLDAKALTKATGVNITQVETKFSLDSTSSGGVRNEISGTNSLLRDIFISCSADRDRIYTLTINLEIDNPFKTIDLRFRPLTKENNSSGTFNDGSFRIRLSQSTFLIQLSQRINYEDCLDVNYVQLAPNVAYEINCIGCENSEQEHLDRIFSKRMSQLDAQLDSILSEKILLGLQILLSQQRLNLDLLTN